MMIIIRFISKTNFHWFSIHKIGVDHRIKCVLILLFYTENNDNRINFQTQIKPLLMNDKLVCLYLPQYVYEYNTHFFSKKKLC